MNRTEATAVYVIMVFAIVAGAAQHWAAKSPMIMSLVAAHLHQAAPQALPKVAALEALPAQIDAEMALSQAMTAKAQVRCRETQIRLAKAHARLIAREARLQAVEAMRQWHTVNPNDFVNVNVQVQP